VDYWRKVSDLVDEHNADLWVILNGDGVEGWHHNTTEVVSLRPDDMERIAVRCLEPYVRRAQQFFVTIGTEAHVGAGGLWDEIIARDLGANGPADELRHGWYWLELECEGVHFAFSHHGRAGQRESTRGTGTRTIAAELTAWYTRNKKRLPQYAMFGHVHRFEDSGDNYSVHVRTSGCWQLSTAHGARIRPGLPPDIGGLVYVVSDGRVVNPDPVVRYTPADTTVWTSQ
jgi:hypothetical protein